MDISHQGMVDRVKRYHLTVSVTMLANLSFFAALSDLQVPINKKFPLFKKKKAKSWLLASKSFYFNEIGYRKNPSKIGDSADIYVQIAFESEKTLDKTCSTQRVIQRQIRTMGIVFFDACATVADASATVGNACATVAHVSATAGGACATVADTSATAGDACATVADACASAAVADAATVVDPLDFWLDTRCAVRTVAVIVGDIQILNK